MANFTNWKEQAILECKEKGLYSLNKYQKEDIYLSAFNKLKRIEIDKKDSNELLRLLRGD